MSDTATIDPPERMNVPQFLQWNDGTDTRYELIDGIPRAMTAPQIGHQRIVANMLIRFRERLPQGCSVELGGGIWWDETHWFEPDLTVTCKPQDTRQQYVDSPIVIIEVLSPSTRNHDQGFKLDRYKAVESVRDILLVDATRRWVEHWQRDEEGIWRARDHVGSGEIALVGVPMVLAIDALYTEVMA